MTGFATKSLLYTNAHQEQASITVQLKTLNTRYFEANCRLPHQLSHLETELIKRFKQRLLRGNIFFQLHVDNLLLFKGAVQPALTTIDHYVQAINLIKERYQLSDEIHLDNLLSLPNIFVTQERSEDEQLTKLVLSLADELITLVYKERQQEGHLLFQDLKHRLTIMLTNILAIEQRTNELITQQQAFIKTELATHLPQSQNIRELEQHLISALLEKMDVNEEVIRFKGHINKLFELLDNSDMEKGKRIDFTLQELGREINTIGAKSADSFIGSLVINNKVEIEKAREQTQNIV